MILIFEHFLVVLGTTLVALAMILVLQPRRSPQSAVAWILFIVALPYLALPLFLALGFRKQRRSLRKIRFAEDPAAGRGPVPPAPEAARLFHRLGASAALAGNRLALQAAPSEARSALEALVGAARTRLDVLLYIVADDDSGRHFIRLLTARAQQGVTVRLALDRLGTLTSRPRAELAQLVAAGADLRFVSPFLGLRQSGGLNLRNHRKMVIADGAAVWTGGRNVGDAYLDDPDARWSDLSLTVSGPIAQAYATVFDTDWRLAGGSDLPDLPAPAAQGPHLVQLVPAGPDEARDLLHDGLVSAIHRAQDRIWIATPYFIPTEALALALATAARAGRDVRLFLPDRSNQWTADLARGAYLREALRAGCRVFRHGPGMLHAKAGLIDGWGWTGSANFDVRSMLLNFETALMLYDPDSAAALEAWFAALAPACTEGLRPATAPRRLAEGIFRLGAPIL